MGKFDDFDLDVKVNKGSNVKPSIFSVVACTHGTCQEGCQSASTFYSNCCKMSEEITKTTITVTTVTV